MCWHINTNLAVSVLMRVKKRNSGIAVVILRLVGSQKQREE